MRAIRTSGDSCNAVKVHDVPDAQVPRSLPRSGSRAARRAPSSPSPARAPCKRPGAPLDIALVLDRTRLDVDPRTSPNVKNAATRAAQGLRREPAGRRAARASVSAAVAERARSRARRTTRLLGIAATWLAVPLSTDYKNPDGNAQRRRVRSSRRINCLERAATPDDRDRGNRSPSPATRISATRWRLRGLCFAIDQAAYGARRRHLHDRRPGEPAVTRLHDRCSYARRTSTAKQTGTARRGRGVHDRLRHRAATRAPITCGTYPTGGCHATSRRRSLADMATNSTDNAARRLRGDREHRRRSLLLRRTRNDDLAAVFKQIAIAIGQDSRLIDVD